MLIWEETPKKPRRSAEEKRARDEALKNAQLAIAPRTPDGLTFLVQGSARDPYTVVFDREDHNVTTRCTCPAGRFRFACKHRLALIMGDVTSLASDNIGDMETLHLMLLDSDVQEAYEHFLTQRELQRAGQLTAAAWKAVKKQLAQAFAD